MLLSHHPFLSDGLGFCRSFPRSLLPSFIGLSFHIFWGWTFHFKFLVIPYTFAVGRCFEIFAFFFYNPSMLYCSILSKNAGWIDFPSKMLVYSHSVLSEGVDFQKFISFVSLFYQPSLSLGSADVSSQNFLYHPPLLCHSCFFRGRDFSVSWHNSLVPSLSSPSSIL